MPDESPPAAHFLPGRLQLLALAFAVEGFLALAALAWAYWRGIPLWSHMLLDGRAALWIAVTTAAMGVVNIAGYNLLLARGVRAAERLDELITPVFARSGVFDLLLIALMAGIGEELLFRGVIMPELGIAASGILFGLMHFAGRDLWFYTVWAVVIGIFFGNLYQWTGNLLVPIAVHAAYDFVALLYIRFQRAPVVAWEDVKKEGRFVHPSELEEG